MTPTEFQARMRTLKTAASRLEQRGRWLWSESLWNRRTSKSMREAIEAEQQAELARRQINALEEYAVLSWGVSFTKRLMA